MHTKIEVVLDDSVKDVSLFQRVRSFSISQLQIFKNGALNFSPPKNISESNFDYIESKVPHLQEFWKDYLEMRPNQLVTQAGNEEATVLHEVIGVGVAIEYTIALLDVNPNRFTKIPRHGTEKILDFKLNVDDTNYELECRGTAIQGSVRSKLNEILAKKANKPPDAIRFGCVTLIRQETETANSTITIGDDFNEVKRKVSRTMMDYARYYQNILSFILDNRDYNKLAKRIEKGPQKKKKKSSAPMGLLNVARISGRYTFNNAIYYGNYFDRRLILEKIREQGKSKPSLDTLFDRLTRQEGKDKIFLGIHSKVVIAIAESDLNALAEFEDNRKIEENGDEILFLDRDGVLIVNDQKNKDPQFILNFPEATVKERLQRVYNFTHGKLEKCGQPCRSRELRGKPCDILTYRGSCHYHR